MAASTQRALSDRKHVFGKEDEGVREQGALTAGRDHRFAAFAHDPEVAEFFCSLPVHNSLLYLPLRWLASLMRTDLHGMTEIVA